MLLLPFYPRWTTGSPSVFGPRTDGLLATGANHLAAGQFSAKPERKRPKQQVGQEGAGEGVLTGVVAGAADGEAALGFGEPGGSGFCGAGVTSLWRVWQQRVR